MRTTGAIVLVVVAALGSRARAEDGTITWQKDLTAAREVARKEGKLVLDFLLIGALDRPDC
jgi:hypothetical protein